MKYIAFSLPTGIGATIGGFAGDIGYIVREFSKYFKVIVNPNAVNGGILSAINDKMLYTEGFAFDNFLAGNINLKPVEVENKIGVLFDRAIPENILNVHINTINAAKKVWGLNILEPVFTKKPVGVEFSIKNSTSSGTLNNPDTLLEAAQRLIKAGADVICPVCYFNEDSEDEDYSNGVGIDPIGGVEAIISHLIVKKFNVMAAHAPAFFDIDISEKIENPKVASECISSTYLPCTLLGLSKAPKLTKNGGITSKDILALVVPESALGSKAVLGAIEANIKVLAVSNPSKLDVGFKKLNSNDILKFDSYSQCLQYLREFENGN